jgi:hypothetical protein
LLLELRECGTRSVRRGSELRERLIGPRLEPRHVGGDPCIERRPRSTDTRTHLGEATRQGFARGRELPVGTLHGALHAALHLGDAGLHLGHDTRLGGLCLPHQTVDQRADLLLGGGQLALKRREHRVDLLHSLGESGIDLTKGGGLGRVDLRAQLPRQARELVAGLLGRVRDLGRGGVDRPLDGRERSLHQRLREGLRGDRVERRGRGIESSLQERDARVEHVFELGHECTQGLDGRQHAAAQGTERLHHRVERRQPRLHRRRELVDGPLHALHALDAHHVEPLDGHLGRALDGGVRRVDLPATAFDGGLERGAQRGEPRLEACELVAQLPLALLSVSYGRAPTVFALGLDAAQGAVEGSLGAGQRALQLRDVVAELVAQRALVLGKLIPQPGHAREQRLELTAPALSGPVESAMERLPGSLRGGLGLE